MGVITVRDEKTGEEVTLEREVHVSATSHYPGVEYRDSETGEVIFPGKRFVVVPATPSDKEGGE